MVLSGGGARAAYEVGVLKTLMAGPDPPEVFCGTGAGAFNAAVIASRLPGQFPEPVEYLRSLWADEIPREGLMRNSRVYRRRLDTAQFADIPFMWNRPFKSWKLWFADAGDLVPRMLSGTAPSPTPENLAAGKDVSMWQDMSPMLRLISESIHLGVIRDGEARPPRRALRIVATELATRKSRVFSNADFTDEDGFAIIQATCALHNLFPPVTIRGTAYVAGSWSMPVALQPALDAGCTVLHIIHLDPRKPLDVSAVPSTVTVHVHQPKQVIGDDAAVLNFDRGMIEASIAAGERDSQVYATQGAAR